MKLPSELSGPELARLTGYTEASISRIRRGYQTVPRDRAYEIYDETGLKFGHIENMTDKDIAKYRALEAR